MPLEPSKRPSYPTHLPLKISSPLKSPPPSRASPIPQLSVSCFLSLGVMGRAAVLACLVLAIAAALWTGTAAQSSCGSVLYTLVQCLSFVQGVSSTPAPSCCSALGSLIKSQPECLCWLRNSTVSDQDKARALTLPSICNVETPSITLCNGKLPSPYVDKIGFSSSCKLI